MIKTMFLVPERNNDGHPFAHSLWEDLEQRILLSFDGMSVRAGVRGAWRSGDRTYRDVSREFTVSLLSWRGLAGWLALVDWARDAFEQEAIYIEVAGIPEILVATQG